VLTTLGYQQEEITALHTQGVIYDKYRKT